MVAPKQIEQWTTSGHTRDISSKLPPGSSVGHRFGGCYMYVCTYTHIYIYIYIYMYIHTRSYTYAQVGTVPIHWSTWEILDPRFWVRTWTPLDSSCFCTGSIPFGCLRGCCFIRGGQNYEVHTWNMRLTYVNATFRIVYVYTYVCTVVLLCGYLI